MLLDVVFQVVPVLEVVIVRLVQIPRLVVEGIDRQVRQVVVLIVRVVARERPSRLRRRQRHRRGPCESPYPASFERPGEWRAAGSPRG